MSQVWIILRQAFRLVSHDYSTSLRVLLPGLLGLAAIEVFSPTVKLAALGGPQEAMMLPLPFLCCVLILALIMFNWSAIGLHRYALRGEMPDATAPPWPGGRLWRYWLQTILLAIVAFVPGIVISTVVAVVLKLSTGLFLLGTLTQFLMLRFGLVVVATAVDEPLNLGDSWQATAPLWGVLLRLSALVFFASFLLKWLQQTLLPGQIFGIIVSALLWVASLAIITVLYGQLVEKRPLTVR